MITFERSQLFKEMITELLVYSYFNDYFKMIAIDLSLQALDADPKAIQQIIFHANLD